MVILSVKGSVKYIWPSGPNLTASASLSSLSPERASELPVNFLVNVYLPIRRDCDGYRAIEHLLSQIGIRPELEGRDGRLVKAVFFGRDRRFSEAAV